MYKLLVLSLLFAAVVGQMTQAQRDFILNAHNQKRRQLATASNMIEMRYDLLLEQDAQNYLNNVGCSPYFQHNPNRGCDYTNLGGQYGGGGAANSGNCASIGENWYSGAPDNTTGNEAIFGGAVAQWTDGTCSSWSSPPLKCASTQCSEKQNFEQTGSDSYGACSQNSGGEYLHYTQVMWATTAWVGCGYTVACGTLCDYAYAGNMNLPNAGSIVNSNIWKIGTACSACPSGYTVCDNGLCAVSGSTPVTSSPATAPATATTKAPTTAAPTTTTKAPTTAAPTTTTKAPTTAAPTTTTKAPTPAPTTTAPTTTKAPTPAPTTTAPTTTKATTAAPTTTKATTVAPTTTKATTVAPTTTKATTVAPTTTTTHAPAPTTAPAVAPVLPTATYCSSGPQTNEDTEFGPVTLIGYNSTIADTSQCPGGIGVTDLTTMSATVVRGQNYSLTYLRTTCGDYYVAIVAAWADWNQDGVFDSTELIVPFNQGIGTFTYSFVVPLTAKLGATRWRLQAQDIDSTATTTIDPCATDTFYWGDTKDFTLNILPAGLPPVTCAGDATIQPTNGVAGTCLLQMNYGATCTQRCNSGYALSSGSLSSTCGANGRYSPSTAVCSGATAASKGGVQATQVCIPDNIVPVNGDQGTCSNPAFVGSTCVMTCNSGFSVKPGTSLTRTCTSSGWTNFNAVCE